MDKWWGTCLHKRLTPALSQLPRTRSCPFSPPLPGSQRHYGGAVMLPTVSFLLRPFSNSWMLSLLTLHKELRHLRNTTVGKENSQSLNPAHCFLLGLSFGLWIPDPFSRTQWESVSAADQPLLPLVLFYKSDCCLPPLPQKAVQGLKSIGVLPEGSGEQVAVVTNFPLCHDFELVTAVNNIYLSIAQSPDKWVGGSPLVHAHIFQRIGLAHIVGPCRTFVPRSPKCWS